MRTARKLDRFEGAMRIQRGREPIETATPWTSIYRGSTAAHREEDKLNADSKTKRRSAYKQAVRTTRRKTKRNAASELNGEAYANMNGEDKLRIIQSLEARYPTNHPSRTRSRERRPSRCIRAGRRGKDIAPSWRDRWRDNARRRRRRRWPNGEAMSPRSEMSESRRRERTPMSNRGAVIADGIAAWAVGEGLDSASPSASGVATTYGGVGSVRR